MGPIGGVGTREKIGTLGLKNIKNPSTGDFETGEFLDLYARRLVQAERVEDAQRQLGAGGAIPKPL